MRSIVVDGIVSDANATCVYPKPLESWAYARKVHRVRILIVLCVSEA